LLLRHSGGLSECPLSTHHSCVNTFRVDVRFAEAAMVGWTAQMGRKQKFKLRHYGLAEGISRSTWHRQRKAAREREALAAMAAQRQAVLERAEAFAAALARDLDRCAAIHAAMARELAAGA
jgi:hypothetical protein